MRARAVAGGVALAVLVACSNGLDHDPGGRAGRAPVTTASAPTTPPSTTVAAASDPPGAVTVRAAAFSLPAAGPAAGGLRILVRPATPRVLVRRRGEGGPVVACPAVDVAGPAGPSGCSELRSGPVLELAAWGVELRARFADVDVEEVTVTYVPADRSVVLVTPARPAGACAAAPCQATFSLRPPGSGEFSLDGRASGGQPRLTLASNTGPGGSIRTLASVEGGGNLSIRASLDGQSDVALTYREEDFGPVPALTAEILWP